MDKHAVMEQQQEVEEKQKQQIIQGLFGLQP